MENDGNCSFSIATLFHHLLNNPRLVSTCEVYSDSGEPGPACLVLIPHDETERSLLHHNEHTAAAM